MSDAYTFISKFLLFGVVRVNEKVKWSRYTPGVAQRVGTDIALLFHDRVSTSGCVFSRTPRPHFIPGKDPVPILQEAGRAPGPGWTSGNSLPHRESILDRPARSQSLNRLSYPTHIWIIYFIITHGIRNVNVKVRLSLAFVNRYGRSSQTVVTLYQLVIIMGFERCVAKRRVVTALTSFSAISLSR